MSEEHYCFYNLIEAKTGLSLTTYCINRLIEQMIVTEADFLALDKHKLAKMENIGESCIRQITFVQQALREVNARAITSEFVMPSQTLLNSAYEFYARNVISAMCDRLGLRDNCFEVSLRERADRDENFRTLEVVAVMPEVCEIVFSNHPTEEQICAELSKLDRVDGKHLCHWSCHFTDAFTNDPASRKTRSLFQIWKEEMEDRGYWPHGNLKQAGAYSLFPQPNHIKITSLCSGVELRVEHTAEWDTRMAVEYEAKS